MDKKKCSLIIPFYNEKIEDVANVIEPILKTSNIDKIICVDDGSADRSTYDSLKKQFSQINLIRLDKNLGKSGAIKKGLEETTSPYVLLLDSDLSNIKPSEIDEAIEKTVNNSRVDMLILRRVSDPWFSKIIRGEILASGERILLADDLRLIFSGKDPKGYQLEFAINFYMMENSKHAYYFPYSGKNKVKIEKMGIFKGLYKEIVMYKDMLNYAGIVLPIKSLLFFCRKNINEL